MSTVRTRKTPEQRSAEILAAATAIAREDGLAGLSLRAVAQRAGVASGLIAHYHPGMDDLVARVFTDLVAAELDEIRALLERTDSATSAMRTLLATLLDGQREVVTVAWVEAWSLARRNAALAAAVRTQAASWQRFVESIINAGCRDGRFAVEDVPGTAWQLIGMIDGINAQSLARDVSVEEARGRMLLAAEALLGMSRGSLSSAQ